MPSISALMGESWVVFKKTWVSLLVFYLVSIVVFIVVIGSAAAVLFLTGAASMSSLQNNLLAGSLGILTVILGILFLFLFIAWAMIMQIGTIIIISENGKISLKATIKRSIPFILPIILIGFLQSFFILGGFFALIIPGFVFALFFYFTTYEIVFGNKKGLNALRSSMNIVTQNFWGILGRLFLFTFIIFLITIVLVIIVGIPIAFLDKTSSAYTTWILITSIIRNLSNVAISIFSAAFTYTLYKQAKAAAKPGESKLLVPFIISILGIVIMILGVGSLATFVGKNFKNETKMSPYSSFDTQMPSYTGTPMQTTVTGY